VLAAPADGIVAARRPALAAPMNLALRDVRRHLARFVGTAAGLGLLAQRRDRDAGHLRGDGRRRDDPDPGDARRPVDRAARHPRAVRRGLAARSERRGPGRGGARRARARPYTYQLIQREHRGAVMRIALVGLGWPDDAGQRCRWCAAASCSSRTAS
jgi:hypothetical protein